MAGLEIDYQGKMRFLVNARNHSIVVDLAPEKGGEDLGMNPPEVFAASLGTCVGVYVAKYLENAGLDPMGLKISVSWQLSDDKTKISFINLVLSGLRSDIEKRKNAILEVARHCLIHNTIIGHPDITISLA